MDKRGIWMNYTAELARLVTEHPDLPIIPYVSSEVVADDSYGFWYGSLAHVSLERYTIGYWFDPYDGEDCRYYTDNEKDELIEEIAEYKYDGTEEDYAKAEEEVSKIKWKEGIFLYIGLPDIPSDETGV